jgi:putative pyruvate formate lyase activating enzyme
VTYLNIMDQYRPCYRAHEYPLLARRPTAGELERARQSARAAGLRRLAGVC